MKRNIIRLKEIDSTNRFLKERKEEQATKRLTPEEVMTSPEETMTVAVADYQTAGKGQGTHTWEGEAGKNLLFSIEVHPGWVPVSRQFLLSEIGALAIKEALDTYADGFSLKWPNDVYWNDQKISGTLIETTLDSHGIKRCIFGVGININQTQFLSDAPNPVSLAQIVGHEVDREEVLGKMLDSFDRYYSLLRQADYMDVSGIYHLALYRRKGYHWYEDKDGKFEGAFVEVEDDGHLILHDMKGVIRSYAFGEVKFLIADK